MLNVRGGQVLHGKFQQLQQLQRRPVLRGSSVGMQYLSEGQEECGGGVCLRGLSGRILHEPHGVLDVHRMFVGVLPGPQWVELLQNVSCGDSRVGDGLQDVL